MLGLVIVCAAITSDLPGSPSPEDRAGYNLARSSAGRDADAHVKLALWCEAHGLTAERMEHLAMAVASDPSNAAARGLMGLVRDGGRWRRPEDLAGRDREDEKRAAALEEYSNRRARASNTADAQWKLAVWCEENGLKDESRAHLMVTVRLDPGREAAWKRLGCKKVGGRWLNEEQIAANRADAEAQKQANRSWKARLEKLRADLKVRSRKEQAEAELAQVSDTRAVPMALRVFGNGDVQDLARLVQILGQIDGTSASRLLARIAMGAADAETRRVASETLRRRDAREFAVDLIAAIRPVVKYQVQPSSGPGSPGVLLVEGKQFNRRRFYNSAPAPFVAFQPGDILDVDSDGLPVIVRHTGDVFAGRESLEEREAQTKALLGRRPASPPMNASPENQALLNRLDQAVRTGAQGRLDELSEIRRNAGGRRAFVETTIPQYQRIPVGRMQVEAQRSAAVAQAQLEADVAAIEDYNRSAREITARAVDLLREVSGQDHGDNQAAWTQWSADLRGYAMVMPTSRPQPRPTFDEAVAPAYQPAQVPIVTVNGPARETVTFTHSCFGAGTPVRTRSGDRPIETISAGDLVLAQDGATGELSFQPVVAVYHNPPNQTLKVDFGSDQVVVTGIHRFWKAGHGWTMARDLKPGDPVRTANGVAHVVSVEPDRVQPVFNLEVANGRSFFVGKGAALVHDNSLVEPVARPFDVATPLAVKSTRGDGSR